MTKCFTPVTGRRLRVTRLDECGRLIFGGDSQAVAKAWVSATLTAVTTESDAIEVTDADGEVIVLKPAEQKFAGYTAEIVFRRVDPELFNIMTGQSTYLDYNGEVVGLVMNTKIQPKRFALEVWAGAAGGDACENPEAQGDYGYMLLPNLKGGIIGDLAIEAGAINFTISGANSLDGTFWKQGPYDVMLNADPTPVPAPLPTALDKDDHFLVILTGVAPPVERCGARPLLDPASEALTSIAGVVAASVVTFTPTPADISAPAYYEFGDGEFAYLPSSALAATSHTYAEPGTYTVTASTNGKVVSTTVVVAP